MTSGLDGNIRVALTREDGRIVGVRIHSSRPQVAQRLMRNNTPAQAVELAGLMFGLCGKAQSAAAQAACDAALEAEPDDGTRRAHGQAVLVELALEHAWRLFLDWPTVVGRHGPDMETLLALRKHTVSVPLFAETLNRALIDRVLGEPPQVWLARGHAGFADWMAAGKTGLARLFAELPEEAGTGRSEVALLPALRQMDTDFLGEVARTALSDPDFCMRPDIKGQAAETGALSRVRHHPLVAQWIDSRGRGVGARMLARLVELAQMPSVFQDEIRPLIHSYRADKNVGVAAVETARGILIHVVSLVDGNVADYRIVAPTEWNFHPAGTLVHSLNGLIAGEFIDRYARLVCLSLDPCVAYAVEINNA
ncbi:MAG: nickel-dependent hydrogenase large subunit [Burkholderiales bacterium]